MAFLWFNRPMKFSRIAALLTPVALLAPVLISGCGGTGMTTDPRGNVLLADANNYTSDSTLTIPTVQTASGADLTVCWDAIQKDILCHTIVPGTNGIDNVALLPIPNMNKDQVAVKLAAARLTENQVTGYGEFHTDQATGTKCAMLSQFKLGSDVVLPATEYVESTNKTYMLLFTSGTTPGTGARSMIFVEPKASSTNTMVSGPDGCSSNILQFDATLGTKIAIPATDSTKWVLDWADITHDSFGNEVSFANLKRVLVGFYQGKTPADLEAGFLDIEQTATALYEVAVPTGETKVNLGDAKLRGANTAFPGFTQTDGTWMAAVMCDKCQLPAPVVLTVLDPQ
jgi:hypothetical protein